MGNKLPSSWKSVKVSEYQKLDKMRTAPEWAELDNISKLDAECAVFGVSTAGWQAAQYAAAALRLTFMCEWPQGRVPLLFRLGWKWYRPLFDLSRTPAKRTIDWINLTDNGRDTPQTLHYQLAALTMPLFNAKKYKPETIKKRAEKFKNMNMKTAGALAAFFFKSGMNAQLMYLDAEAEKLKAEARRIGSPTNTNA